SKVTREELLELLLKEGTEADAVPNVPDAIRLLSRKNLSGSKSFRKGYFEIQDAGSQLIALFVKAKAGQSVLDGCAGAGGKSLSMALEMQNKGEIVATDLHFSKLKELKVRALRGGITIIKTES